MKFSDSDPSMWADKNEPEQTVYWPDDEIDEFLDEMEAE